MDRRDKVLFLQLPQPDNDLQGEQENIPLAAAYLRHAAERAGEDRHYAFDPLPATVPIATASNDVLLAAIGDHGPGVVACTLYLWNIERTLRLVRHIKERWPSTTVLLGGPEAATAHPFLFRESVADAIAIGEGEIVFPALLQARRTGNPVDFTTVALRNGGGYRWGTHVPEPVDLTQQLPPPGYGPFRPDARGMAYMETSRGCPMRCTYCRYPHLRRSMSFLAPAEILSRVEALRNLGAREIRFVDPTFNAHPRFREIVTGLGRLNRSRSLTFFAELNAEKITRSDAMDLAAARFTEIEVGVQSRDAEVLRTIRRPTHLARLDEGIRQLLRHRIKVTVDIMYALPRQPLGEVRRSLAWALRLPRANVQCLQTLLLPGTELRDRRREWRLRSTPRPPYAVTRTDAMDEEDIRSVERLMARHPRLRSDVPTPRFVGTRLGLFPERVLVVKGQATAPELSLRRAFLFKGNDLFGRRAELAGFIRKAIQRAPDALFQFVLCPRHEEPLDLLEELIAVIRGVPPHLVDRYAAVSLEGRIASRRVMILLPRSPALTRSWIREAEQLLGAAFF